jgi:RimJ/RimL family protein N-acetyltransferase
MNPLEYLHLQLRLEGKKVVGDRLRQAEVVPDEDMPLMVIAQLSDQQVVAYYDEALAPDLSAELVKQVPILTFPTIEPLLALLKAHTISVDVGHYKTYLFTDQVRNFMDHDVRCLSKNDPAVQEFGFSDFAEQVYGIEREGKVVSACVSSRENGACGEAWVYTDEAYRTQGFAQRVVLAWVHDMVNAGKVPFYSHKIDNKASARLAKRLGLKPVFEEIAIAYMHV